MAFNQIFRDDFDDGYNLYETGNGSFSVSGGVLQISNDGLDAEWYNGAGTAPIAYLESLHEKGKVLEYETRITSFTGSGSSRRAAGITLFAADKLNWYQFHFIEETDRVFVQRGNNGSGSTLYESGTVTHPNTTPLRLRITWNVDSGWLFFEFSDNDGTTGYTLAHTRYIDFVPHYVGLFGREYDSATPTFTINYDWLNVDGYDETFETETTGFSDSATFLDQPSSTDDRHTFPQVSPGELTNEPGASFLDNASFMDQPSTSFNTHTTPQLSPGQWQFEQMGINDDASLELTDGPTYMSDKTDADGYELLGDYQITDIIQIDTTVGGFGNPVIYDHYGIAADGYYYWNGIYCGPGPLATAGVFNYSSWRKKEDEPFARPGTSYGTLSISGSTLTFSKSSPQSGWYNIDTVTSNLRWYFPEGEDFDIEIDCTNYSFTGTDANVNLYVESNTDGSEGTNNVRVARGNSEYFRQIVNNGGVTSSATSPFSKNNFKLRLTRTGTNYEAFVKEQGSPNFVTIGGSFTHPTIQDGPVFITISSDVNNASGSVEVNSFTINLGATASYAGWYLEEASASRGIKNEIPATLGVACTNSSLDLLDLDEQKMWMRFEQGSDHVMGATATGVRIRKVVWNDGLLFAAYSSHEAHGGAAIVIDFTMDTVRWYRESGNSTIGAYYTGTLERVDGAIKYRNSSSYSNTDSSWVIPDFRVEDVDIYRNDGYEYRGIVTQEGATISRIKRWYTNSSLNIANSSETNYMSWCAFDEYGTFYYADDGYLYSRDKSNGSTGWEDVMDGGSFSAEYFKAFPGNIPSDSQTSAILYDGYLFIPRNEGVYRIDWPFGSWELFYGKSGSGATHEILPRYSNISAISLKTGSTNFLFCGLEGALISSLEHRDGFGVQIVILDIDSHTVWGKSKIYMNGVSVPAAIGA